MTFAMRLAAIVIASFALCAPSSARPRIKPNDAQVTRSATEVQMKERLNSWSLGLAGGLLEGAPIHFATEIARVVNEGGVMHVLPIVTSGPTENVNDLLYLK